MFQAFSGYLADIHLCYANAITLQDIIQYGLTIFNTIGDDRNTKPNVQKLINIASCMIGLYFVIILVCITKNRHSAYNVS